MTGDLGGLTIPVPEDDDDDEGLFCFGDDLDGDPQTPGIWEIDLSQEWDEPPQDQGWAEATL
jgi:hypothetical protein